MKNKKLIWAVVALLAVVAILAGVYAATRPDTVAGAKIVTVEVVHKDGSTRTFTCHTDEEYLGQVLLDEGIVEGYMGDFGLYITAADGEVADYSVDGGWWGLYQNGEMTATGADTTPIADGDAFSLVYGIG